MMSFINNISELQKHQQLPKHGWNGNSRRISVPFLWVSFIHVPFERGELCVKQITDGVAQASIDWNCLEAKKKKKKRNRGEKEKKKIHDVHRTRGNASSRMIPREIHSRRKLSGRRVLLFVSFRILKSFIEALPHSVIRYTLPGRVIMVCLAEPADVSIFLPWLLFSFSSSLAILLLYTLYRIDPTLAGEVQNCAPRKNSQISVGCMCAEKKGKSDQPIFLSTLTFDQHEADSSYNRSNSHTCPTPTHHADSEFTFPTSSRTNSWLSSSLFPPLKYLIKAEEEASRGPRKVEENIHACAHIS